MTQMSTPQRSAFLAAVGIPDVTLIGRALQRLLGRRPPDSQPQPAAAPGDPHIFQPSEEGSGKFGRWMLDDAGLPAYLYEIDQYKDGHARYPNTEWRDRRDHWHQIGNDRVNALVSNDGTVQLYLNDRGGVFLNRFEAPDEREGLAGWLFGIFGWLIDWYRQFRASRLIGRWQKRVAPRGGPTLQLLARARQMHIPSRTRRLPYAQMRQRQASAEPDVQDQDTTRYAYAGGFSYIDDGKEIWATAYRYRPQGRGVEPQTRRVFGMGYFETEMTYNDIRVRRRIYAPYDGEMKPGDPDRTRNPVARRVGLPYGDDPFLLIDIRIENLSTAVASLRHYEYWDVNVHQLKAQMIRTGLPAAAGDEERRALNDEFAPSINWDSNRPGQVLRFHQQPPDHAPSPDRASPVDWAPADVFLADLSGTPDAVYTDKADFFGSGGVSQPDVVRERRKGETRFPQPKNAMPYCMVMQRRLRIEPGKSVALRYAYGAARPKPPDQPAQPRQRLTYLDPYRIDDSPQCAIECDPFAHTRERWKQQLACFTSGDPVLQREMAWHAYNLLSATVYHAYYQTHVVPQGSAYLYLHGLDGAPRDQALFALPLAYLRPELARDTLRLVMSLTNASNRAIPYAFTGYGALEDGIIHARPSDLDLFLLLGLSEYLAATGDMDFLDQDVNFYPRGARPALPDGTPLGTTVLDHIRAAVTHLIEDVGIGEHGLIRIGDGDWSDGIVSESKVRDPFGISFLNSRANGESVPNSQMALYVLPLAAALVEVRDAALARQMRALIPDLEAAVTQQWTGRWYRRAILRNIADAAVYVGEKEINLESQPWALISGLATRRKTEEKLIDSIRQRLDDRSLIGAPSLERGQVWPAISQLLTWGYTRCRPDLAWRSLNRNTFAAHATVVRNVWINIWSGPDAINAQDAENPGGTWTSPLTPMTDFPAMNANQDAMALLGLLRVCGVEPAPGGDGLIIAPKAPPERFILDLPLLRLDVAPGRIAGEYRAIVKGSRVLHIGAAQSAHEANASVKGQRLDTIARDEVGRVVLQIDFEAGEAVPFEVRWS